MMHWWPFIVIFTEVFGQNRDGKPLGNVDIHNQYVPVRSTVSNVSIGGTNYHDALPMQPNSKVRATTTTTPTAAAHAYKRHVRNHDASVIPVSFFLNKPCNTLEEFMTNLGIPQERQDELKENFLRTISAAERNGGVAESANCEPQDTVVELERPQDPAVVYFPTCTKVKRCGGCCQHEMLACVHTKTESISVSVMKGRFDPNTNSFVSEGLHPVGQLEHHLECECQCRIKAEHCTEKQEYRKDECRCVCNNEQESESCVGTPKAWDPRTCRCECQNRPECTTGIPFNERTCRCQYEA